MSTAAAPTHPYTLFEGSPQWTALDRALRSLAENKDLVETTQHEYIVGYLCQALDSPIENIPSPEQRMEALKDLREMVRNSDLHGRDLVGELIAERRAEAERE